jgi:glycerol-3-phosphate acyltransferase PlsY
MTELQASWPGIAYVALLAYMLGSISGSLLLGKLRGVDIRTMGSGNAGGTNAFRTQGTRFALLVVLVDIGKGVLAVLLAPWLVALWTSVDVQWGMAFAALSAVMGHIWPLYHRFRGGKGAATAVGAVLAWQPWFALPMFVTWLLVLIATGWVSAATLAAALALPLLHGLLGSASAAGFVATVGLLCLVIWAHRSNIARLWRGDEYRFERARLWHRRGQKD